MSNIVLHATGVSKQYQDAGNVIEVLSKVDLQLAAGESIAIEGASGSGKTTLLQILGGLLSATEGEVTLAGVSLKAQSSNALAKLRNENIGFIYQLHHLLPELTAQENVALPLLLGQKSRKIAFEKADEWLSNMGLSDRLKHTPSQLSGGERQRVAIARACVTEPAVILADEPTGNLDRQTADQVFAEMLSLIDKQNSALLMVTHDDYLASQCQRRIKLVKGCLGV